MNNFNEKLFQSLFTTWVKNNAKSSWPYELKVANGKSLPFTKFQPHQIPELYLAKHGVSHHKISDAVLNYKPYDGFVFANCEFAYVGIMFNTKEGNRSIAYLIDVDVVCSLMIESNRKSITEADCHKYGIKIEV